MINLCYLLQVCLLTYPLTFVAPAQIIESYVRRLNFMQFFNRLFGRPQYEFLGDESEDSHITLFQVLNRMALMLIIAFLAISVPCFGMVSILQYEVGSFKLSNLARLFPC